MRHLRKLVSLNLFDNIALNHKTHQFLKRVPWNVHQSIFQSFTYLCSYFFKLANPGLFFVYFRSLQRNINTIFTTNQCEQTSCQSSIQCWDSNPQPLEHESSPITTRPGLPPTAYLWSSSAFLQNNTSRNVLIQVFEERDIYGGCFILFKQRPPVEAEAPAAAVSTE